MKVCMIGHGNVGGALIERLADKHEIIIGAKNRESEELKEILSKYPSIKVFSAKEGASNADIIIVSIPAPLTAELAKEIGDLKGKVVIDATNSVFKKPEPYRTGFEAFQKITGAELAKCFNTTGAENMKNPDYKIG